MSNNPSIHQKLFREILAEGFYLSAPAVDPETNKPLSFISRNSAANPKRDSAYDWADSAIEALDVFLATGNQTDEEIENLILDYNIYYIVSNEPTTAAYFKIQEMRKEND
jgi:hypothetical protein